MKKRFFTKSLMLLLVLGLVYSLVAVIGCSSSSSDSSPAPAPTVKRTMASDFRSDAAYAYIHGTNSPDGSKLYVVLNNTASAGSSTLNGNFTAYMLKMSDVTAGTVSSSSVLATSSTVTAATAFRQSFTPDGTKIVQAGADRTVVLNAADLSTLHSTTNVGGGSLWFQNHDVLAIDNDYALVAIMSNSAAANKAGGTESIVLYDLATGQTVGNAANLCVKCHAMAATGTAHMACGIDGKFTKTGSTYTGTVYASSTTGGHIVIVPVTIDLTNTTNPISVGGGTGAGTVKVQISDAEGTGTDIPEFHDVRYDAATNRVYYSAIKPDVTGGANDGKVHLGYIDLSASNAKHDATIGIAAGSTSAPVYCGSGQTADFFIPQTMNYPAYIDAIPKSLITTGAALNP
jgi:hypothetical protein